MNSFYKVKVDYWNEDPKEYSGIVVGVDEGDMMKKLMDYYGRDDVTQVSFWFGDFYENDIVEFDDLKDCPLFDFPQDF